MPYANSERQKAAKRESARRQRAAANGTGVEPAVTADLATAGDMLCHRKGVHESDEAYRARLQSVWRVLLRVVE